MADATRPIILRPGEGRSIDLGNFAMSVKATADDTNHAFTLLEADEPPGFGPPMHIHRDAAEAFYVLVGEYNIFVRDEEYACPAGSFVYIPAGVPHGFRVGPTPSRKLNLYAPSAMVGYFDELSLSDAAVDLVYLDPPVNSNRDDNVILRDESGSATDAQLLAFEDTWHLA